MVDFALSDQQKMLKRAARKFLEKECPTTVVRELLASPEGYSPALWRKMAELGWLALPFPEEYGGIGGSFLDLAVILEEMGRALLPGPFFSTVLLGGYPLLRAGSERQKASLLEQLTAGELIMTMAIQESGAAYDPGDVSLNAKEAGPDYVLEGTKLFVPNGHIADTILTVVRASSGHDRHGLGMALVERGNPDLHCTVLRTTDDSKLCEVHYDGVRIHKDDFIGDVDGAWPIIEDTLARAAVGECLQLVGSAGLALELSVEYAKNRVQFGRPIGTYQAVQHHCANMATDLDGARFLSYQAAWKLSEGIPCAKDVAMAKAWVSDACHRVIATAHQVLGAVGFITEHDLTLHFKRSTAGQAAFGGPNFHYRALARTLDSLEVGDGLSANA